ncbi:MAG: YicC/YloC family endoribonuclease [Flavobacteriaceae bacterium]
MVLSMTGYGKSEATYNGLKVFLEVRSLNSKNLDVNTRIPNRYREMDAQIRKTIAAQLQRGKVDCSLFYENTDGQTNAVINLPVVESYMHQLDALAQVNDKEKLEIAMRLPDVLKVDRDNLEEAEKSLVHQLLEAVLKQLNTYRKDEGQALYDDFVKRLRLLQKYLSTVAAADPQRKEAVRQRLQEAVAETKEKIDPNRFEQELIYYLEKFDITEELVRLENHLKYFEENLNAPQSQGKKLGFIAQEIGREINTIGSKVNDATVQHTVVQMKDELEKIKEQLLNVL